MPWLRTAVTAGHSPGNPVRLLKGESCLALTGRGLPVLVAGGFLGESERCYWKARKKSEHCIQVSSWWTAYVRKEKSVCHHLGWQGTVDYTESPVHEMQGAFPEGDKRRIIRTPLGERLSRQSFKLESTGSAPVRST